MQFCDKPAHACPALVLPGRRSPADHPLVCGLTLSVVLSIAACGSNRPTGPVPPDDPPLPSASFSVSGRVLEVRGAHIPVADFPVFVRVLSRNCSAPVCRSQQATRTGPDGRYSFSELPEGRVVVTASSMTHTQVCGATAILSATTQLDVEITSRTNRQPSLIMPPLSVSGQLFRMTPGGRVGVSHGEIGVLLSLDMSAQTTVSAFFLEVDADANGNYLACGLPANWPILFVSGFEDYEKWHQFSADGMLDIERKNP